MTTAPTIMPHRIDDMLYERMQADRLVDRLGNHSDVPYRLVALTADWRDRLTRKIDAWVAR